MNATEHLPPTPLDHYLEQQGLDASELEALLELVDAKLAAANTTGARRDRLILWSCREAIIAELRALRT